VGSITIRLIKSLLKKVQRHAPCMRVPTVGRGVCTPAFGLILVLRSGLPEFESGRHTPGKLF
jgi:hypothetical protein